MIRDLAIMVMEIADVDMKIVNGEGYALGYNSKRKLSAELVIPKEYKCCYKALDLIEELYGINIEHNEVSDSIFAIAHEIGHYMELANKSKLARLIHSIRTAKVEKAKDNAYEELMKLEFKLYCEGKEDKELVESKRHECDISYRLLPSEAFADKWAIEFIKANFPELIVG